MTRLVQRVVYEVDGKPFASFADAEMYAADKLGDHIDGMFKTIDAGSMNYIQQSKMLTQLVGRMWDDRERLCALLTLDYVPATYIHELIDDQCTCDN